MSKQTSSEMAILPVPDEAMDLAIVDTTANDENTTTSKQSDPFLVEFDPVFDAENPRQWRRSKKWTVTDVLSATTFNRILVSTILAPALPSLAKEFDLSGPESSMILSIYLLATAFGPLIIGPLSEVYGRTPVLHASNVWFLIWNIACGFSNSKQLLIASRFLAGFGASAIYALGAGVLGDLWSAEERGKSLGLYILVPLLAACIGPILGGVIVAHTTWRWLFWSTSIFQACMIGLSFLAFRETYAPQILHLKAKRLRKETGDNRYYTIHERRDAEQSLARIIGRSLMRPIKLLIFHPIIQIMSLLSGLGYGTLYLVIATYATLWIDKYHQSSQIAGLHYISLTLGEICGSQIGGRLMDKVYAKLKRRRAAQSGETEDVFPEFHLPLIIPGTVLTAVGLLVYGWAAHFHTYWLVVDIGVFITTFAMQLRGQPVSGYVIDTYPEHTSSAIAAQQMLRSLAAYSFPLFASALYKRLGYGWTNSMMAFVTLVFGVPVPIVMWFYGPKLRKRMRSTY